MSDPQDRFIARMRLLSQEEFGTSFRPGFAQSMAQGTASLEDMQRIGAFVRALDQQKIERLAHASGAVETTTGAGADLLNGVGAGAEQVQKADYHQAASADADLPWWQDAGMWLTTHLYGVDPTKADMTDSSLVGALTNPAAAGLGWALEQLVRVPGFAYRSINGGGPVGAGIAAGLGLPTVAMNNIRGMGQRNTELTAQGYTPNNVWDEIAFNWTQGESTYRDLSPLRQRYGNEAIDLALEINRTIPHGANSRDALYGYQVQLENEYAEAFGAGDTERAQQILDKVKLINGSEFVDGPMEAVDRYHISPGRDMARLVTGDNPEDAGPAYTAFSGYIDALYTLMMDPTLVAGKAFKGAQMARYGIEALDSPRVYTILGERNPVTGALPSAREAGDFSNIKRFAVNNLLTDAAEWRAASAGGNTDLAAAIYARAEKRNPELMALWSEINGVRPVMNQAEQAAAKAAGTWTRHVTPLGVEHPLGGVRAAPITTVKEFADHLYHTTALVRLANGIASSPRPMMPGKIGYWAERRAQAAFNRTLKGAGKARAGGVELIEFTDDNLARIIGDASQDALEKAAAARGQQLFDESRNWRDTATWLRRRSDALGRRMSTALPDAEALNIYAATDSKLVERLSRAFLPKWEATRLASMWAFGSPATRRTIAHGLLQETMEASGLTRSVVGKEMADKYLADLSKLDLRRYGFGDADLIEEGYSGIRRGGMYPNQMDGLVAIPAWTELRRLAAKAAVLGYDPGLSTFKSTAFAKRAATNPLVALNAGRYMLFSSEGATRLFKLVKLGWIGTYANMLRNVLDESGGLWLSGNSNRLGRGRQLQRDARLTADLSDISSKGRFRQAVRAVANHRIPRELRGQVQTVRDFTAAINHSNLNLVRGPGGVSDRDVLFADELHEQTLASDVVDMLGGRTIDNAGEVSLGHEFAREAHRHGVPLERWRFQGYTLEPRRPLEDGGHGIKALSGVYGQRFTGPSPAHAVLGYLLWHNALEDPAFREALTEETQQIMAALFPKARFAREVTEEVTRLGPERPPAGVPTMLTPAEFEATGQELLHGTSAKFTTFSGDRNFGNTGRGAGDRVYMTDQPHVANTFAFAGSGKAAQILPDEEIFWDQVVDGHYAGVTSEAKDRLYDAMLRVEQAAEVRPKAPAAAPAEVPKAAPAVTPVKPTELDHGDTIEYHGQPVQIRTVSDWTPTEKNPTAPHGFTGEVEIGAHYRILDLDNGAREIVKADAGTIKRIGPGQGDVRGSGVRVSQIAKLAAKGKLADQPAKRRGAVRVFNQEFGHDAINLDDEAVLKVVDDTTRGSADRFGQLLHNRSITARQKMPKNEAPAVERVPAQQVKVGDTLWVDEHGDAWNLDSHKARNANVQGAEKTIASVELKTIKSDKWNRERHYVLFTMTDGSRVRMATGVKDGQWLTSLKMDVVRRAEPPSPEEARLAAYAELRAAEQQAMRELLTRELQRMWRVAYRPNGGKRQILSSPDELDRVDPEDLSESSLWEFIPPNRDPRVIKATVYGKTIDLREWKHVRNKDGEWRTAPGRGTDPMKNPNQEIPDSLREALDAKVGGWKPWTKNHGSNRYGHEFSRELTEWMRANGYGKAMVDDAPESGMWSYLVLPEMIAHGANDPVASYLAKYNEALASVVAATPETATVRRMLPPVPPTLEDVADYIRRPEFSGFRSEAELYNLTEDGVRIRPDDAEALNRRVHEMAGRTLTDIKLAVTGRDGQIHPELAERLLKGDIPSPDELAALGDEALPPHVITAQYGVPAGGPGSRALDGLTALMERFYDAVVTRPTQYLVRTPLYVDAYVTARHQTDRFARFLINRHGWSEDVAHEYARNIASKQALADVLRYVDNPRVASQFSGMNNNWWSFYRAQENWLLRYGRIMKADPTAIRKAQLAVYGGEQAGILDRDAEGNLIVTYPGSGAVTEALLHAFSFLGMGDSVLIPHVPDLQTRLTFLNPSLNSPFGYSSTPMVSLPIRAISNIVPGGELFDKSVDRMINGELGAGRAWWEQIMPTPVLRIAQIGTDWKTEDTGGVVGGAVATAMMHMAITGQLGKYSDTATDRQRFITDVRTQARNALIVRSVFGFGLPGAPGMPQLGDDGVTEESDPAYFQAGIRNMREEFRQMVARMGPGAAYSLWVELHPNLSVYLEGGNTKSAPGARTPATMTAAGYVMANRDFFTGEYAEVAPYFMLETPGAFSQTAWNALVEMDIRQHRDLDELFIELATNHGVTAWYQAQDAHDEAVADARLVGDTAAAARLDAAWEQRKKDLNAQYPALDDWRAEGPQRRLRRLDAIEKLRTLVADPDAPGPVQPQMDGVARMLQVYNNFEAANVQLKGQRSSDATAQRQNLRVGFHDAMRTIIRDYPSLEDMYNGVFRSLVDSE